MLSACATYQAHPLAQSPALAASIGQLRMRTDSSSHPELPEAWRKRQVKADNGLDETEVAVLAVLNSPHLQAARAQMGEARALLIRAGLLPDPQFSTAVDIPTGNNHAQVTGYSFGLGLDLQSLITRGARIDAATEQARATYLNILWREWQVIQQARMLYRRTLIQQRQIQLAHDQFLLTRQVWESHEKALDQGNTTLKQEGLARTSMKKARTAWVETRRRHNATVHALALLLGLNPSVQLPLASAQAGPESVISSPPGTEPLRAMLSSLGTRRPDLLALQAGYSSQEARVREQILSQFPSLSIGVNRSRDTGNVWSIGPFINLGLPILNGNRGNIATARATRLRLQAEYRDRLATAHVQVRKLAQDQRLAFDEWRALMSRLSRQSESVKLLEGALQSGDIDMPAYISIRSAYVARQGRRLTLEQTLLEQQVALETLTGTLLHGPAAHQGK